jgi:hypothetical protein
MAATVAVTSTAWAKPRRSCWGGLDVLGASRGDDDAGAPCLRAPSPQASFEAAGAGTGQAPSLWSPRPVVTCGKFLRLHRSQISP